MESTINFIKDFKLASYGLNERDIWIGFGVIMLVYILSNVIISRSPSLKNTNLSKWLTFALYTILYGAMMFWVLQAFLVKDYGTMSFYILAMITPHLKQWLGFLYRRYDHVVDKLVSRKSPRL